MRTMEQYFKDTDRLAPITQRVGFALWKFQKLEGVAAQLFALMAQATRGMGEEVGNLLLAKVQRDTFGDR